MRVWKFLSTFPFFGWTIILKITFIWELDGKNNLYVLEEEWWNKLTALAVALFSAFGQGHNIVLGKHPGFVCELSALSTQWLAAGVTVIHGPSILCTYVHAHTVKKMCRNYYCWCISKNEVHVLFRHLCFALHITVSTLYYTVCQIIHQELDQTVLWGKCICPLHDWGVSARNLH